jgi:hypothetical protein
VSKVISPASNPQPEWSGLCIYILQWQGGPVIFPGTGFHFRHLLQLTGLWWRYSNPLPYRTDINTDKAKNRGLSQKQNLKQSHTKTTSNTPQILHKESCILPELSDRKIWSWVLQDPQLRITVLLRPSSNLPDRQIIYVYPTCFLYFHN